VETFIIIIVAAASIISFIACIAAAVFEDDDYAVWFGALTAVCWIFLWFQFKF
jgi:hypothetical protein